MSPYNKDGNLKSKKTTLANGSESVTEYPENEITTTVDDKKYISRSKSDGLSRKLNKGTITFNEVMTILDILGYEIDLKK